MMNRTQLLHIAREAALEAAEKIIDIYNSGDFSIEAKADDSPLTLADTAAHQIIEKHLSATGLPMLSEEGRNIPYEDRKRWPSFWMIDPLDGTKEFIKKNDEFTVNIALIENGQPILGVVHPPVLKQMYTGIADQGASMEHPDGTVERLIVNGKSIADEGLKVVASRSHLSPETEEFMRTLRHPQIVSKGSSLKLLMVARGEADLYPRYAPTMEWDTAAAHLIVNEAGGHVWQATTNTPLNYNKSDLLNPFFLCTGCKH